MFINQRTGEIRTEWGPAGFGTNNYAEVWAIWNAVLLVPGRSKALIVTDSENAWHWCRNGPKSTTPPRIRAILKDIGDEMVRSSLLLTFDWVKGHSGLRYNEQADRLARAGAKRQRDSR